MSTLYSIRKKFSSNSFVKLTVKKIYMLFKNIYLKRHALFEIKKIKKIVEEVDNIVFYLDVPTHPNMGDLAQYCCTLNWLKINYPDYYIVEVSAEIIIHAESEFKSLLLKNDFDKNLIIFQSGYCTQDLGGTHDYVHKLVVSLIHNMPIIMLPQTILYKNKKRAAQTAEIYAANQKLMILCRDSVSYKLAEELFPRNFLLPYPDIVTSLIGNIEVTNGKNRTGILICCRNDIERFYSNNDIKKLKEKLSQIDKVTISDTTIQCDFSKIQNKILEYVNNMIDEFGHYKVVITDRYHGTIFSLIAGTPVIVIKSNDHKVSTGVDWFKGIYDDYVWYLPEINDVSYKVQEIYRQFNYKKLKPYFEVNYYKNLKTIIEKWRKSK